MKNKYLLFIIMLSLLLVIAGCGKSKEPAPDFVSNENIRLITLDQIKEEYHGDWDELSSLIKSVHNILNNALGYGKIPEERNLTALNNFIKQLDPLLSNINFDPLKQDLEDLVTIVLSLEPDKRNSDWLNAHRIIHDLDSFVINATETSQSKDFWGATRTVTELSKKVSGE